MRISFLRRHTPPVNYTAACSLRRIVIRSTQPAGRAEPSQAGRSACVRRTSANIRRTTTALALIYNQPVLRQLNASTGGQITINLSYLYNAVNAVQLMLSAAVPQRPSPTNTLTPFKLASSVTKDLLGIYTLCPQKSSTPNSRR